MTRAATLLVVCLALTAGCSFLGPAPDSYSSHHYYSVGVDLDGNVSGVTIRLPVPQQGGDATYDVTTLTGNGTVEGVFDATVVDTDRGPMLELTADAVTRELAACGPTSTGPATCFAYDAPVYLSYEADGDIRVAGIVAFEGTNEWFAGGWTGNSYVDRVRFNATGPQDGWTTFRGETETGVGSYPAPEP